MPSLVKCWKNCFMSSFAITVMVDTRCNANSCHQRRSHWGVRKQFSHLNSVLLDKQHFGIPSLQSGKNPLNVEPSIWLFWITICTPFLHDKSAFPICHLSFRFVIDVTALCFIARISIWWWQLLTVSSFCFFGVRKSQFCTALTSDQALSWIWICCLMNHISILAAAQSVGMPILISSSSEFSCQCSQRQFSSRLNSNHCFLILNCAHFTTCSSHSHISIALSCTACSSFTPSVCV